MAISSFTKPTALWKLSPTPKCNLGTLVVLMLYHIAPILRIFYHASTMRGPRFNPTFSTNPMCEFETETFTTIASSYLRGTRWHKPSTTCIQNFNSEMAFFFFGTPMRRDIMHLMSTFTTYIIISIRISVPAKNYRYTCSLAGVIVIWVENWQNAAVWFAAIGNVVGLRDTSWNIVRVRLRRREVRTQYGVCRPLAVIMKPIYSVICLRYNYTLKHITCYRIRANYVLFFNRFHTQAQAQAVAAVALIEITPIVIFLYINYNKCALLALNSKHIFNTCPLPTDFI